MSLTIGTRRAVLGPAPRAADDAPTWFVLDGYSAIAAYQPKGAANLAASLVDLTGNGNDATGTPTWDATNGWTDGTATTPGFLTNTGVWSVAVLADNPGGSTDFTFIDGGRLSIRQRATAGGRFYGNHHSTYQSLYTGHTFTGGVAVLAYDKLYDGGVLKLTLSTVAALTNGAASTLSSSSAQTFSIQAVAYYNAQLDATAVSTLTTAMAAL